MKRTTWRQVDGDVNIEQHGGTLARFIGNTIELRKIQPVVEYVVEREAVEVGYPFWTREAQYDITKLLAENPSDDVRSAMQYAGLVDDGAPDWSAELTDNERAIVIACACLDLDGHYADDGPAGWCRDVFPRRARYWDNKIHGPTYFESADREFRRMLKDNA